MLVGANRAPDQPAYSNARMSLDGVASEADNLARRQYVLSFRSWVPRRKELKVTRAQPHKRVWDEGGIRMKPENAVTAFLASVLFTLVALAARSKKILIVLLVGALLNLLAFIPLFRWCIDALNAALRSEFATTRLGMFGAQMASAAMGAFLSGAVVGFILKKREIIFGMTAFVIVFAFYLFASLSHHYAWWPAGWSYEPFAFKTSFLLIGVGGGAAGGNWPKSLRRRD
jgi:hypothetical protein